MIERQVNSMNPNMKVIDDKIWTVSFFLVGTSNIEEMCVKKTVSPNSFVAITKSGQYLLDNDDDYSNKYLPYLKVITTFPCRLIDTQQGFCLFMRLVKPEFDKLSNKQIELLLSQNKLSGLKEVFEIVCTWEKARRKVKKISHIMGVK